VCGSSVIFFDPIFQGMAISLASGVLVSTVLTLIVIPLGCIAASKDIREVAAATLPAGVSLEEASEKVSEEAIPAVAASPTSDAVKSESGKKDSLPIKIWHRMIALFSMLFYLVRGIFLLIGQLIKGLFRRGKPRQPPIDRASDKTGGGTSGGPSSNLDTTQHSYSTPSGDEDVPVAAAPAATVDKAKAQQQPKEKEAVFSEVSARAQGGKPARQVNASKQAAKADAAEERHKRIKKKHLKSAEMDEGETKTDSNIPAVTGAKQKKRPSTLKKQVAKKRPASAKTKDNGAQEADSLQTQAAAKPPASNVSNFPIRKKTARRGIRLK
jgi:hypothetical protein